MYSISPIAGSLTITSSTFSSLALYLISQALTLTNAISSSIFSDLDSTKMTTTNSWCAADPFKFNSPS